MAQNKQYQNVNEKELYDDDPGQTEISRRSKCCFKIYNLWTYIYIETKSAILNFGVKLLQAIPICFFLVRHHFTVKKKDSLSTKSIRGWKHH